MATHPFAAWADAPGGILVCEACGKEDARGDHLRPEDPTYLASDPRYASYEEAIFNWTVTHGGIPAFYGGLDERATVNALLHLELCALDIKKSAPPALSTKMEFADTFNDPEEIEVTAAKLTCKCCLIEGLEWSLPQVFTVGEIIFQVVKSGEEGAVVPEPAEPSATASKRIDSSVSRLAKTAKDPVKSEKLLRANLVPALWRACYKFKVSQFASRSGEYVLGPSDISSSKVWDLASHFLADFKPDTLELLLPTRKAKAPLTYASKRALGW